MELNQARPAISTAGRPAILGTVCLTNCLSLLLCSSSTPLIIAANNPPRTNEGNFTPGAAELAISDSPPGGSTSCQTSIATPFGNGSRQARDFGITHVTVGGSPRVLLVSISGDVAQ